jgi:hypothetical protein
MYVEVNQIQRRIYGAEQPPEWGTLDREGFIEPEGGRDVAGHPRAGGVFIVKKNPKPLWIPLGLGDALEPVIAVLRDTFENRRSTRAKQLADFEARQTPAARAARKADLEKTAKMLPNPQEFLSQTEQSDREVEAMTRAELAPGGPMAREVAAAERELREAEALLASLTPEQRSAASCYDESATGLARRFRAKDGARSSCRPLVKPNWGYFDRTLPRAAPQVVMLWEFDRCLTPESIQSSRTDGCTVNRRLIEALDWPAVMAWLDR